MEYICFLSTFLGALVGMDDPQSTTIVFRSGGTMTGELIAETKESSRNYVLFRSKSGSVFKFDKGKTIQRISLPTAEDQNYLDKLAAMESTPDGHWKMYEWCKANGKAKFRDKMRFHLKEIIRMDPEDGLAYRTLGENGEPYKQVDGQWIPEEQYYTSLGYVRFNGRWTPQVLLPEKQRRETAEQMLGARKKDFKNFKKNVLPKRDKQTVRKELFRLVGPLLLSSIERELERNISPELRELYLEAVGQVYNRHAQRILIKYAVEDPKYDVREMAILQLRQEQFTPESTIANAAEYLQSNNNLLVNQAGSLIGQFKNPAGIIPLIGALVTQHKEATGNDPNRTSAGFGSGGTSFSSGGGPKFVTRTRENPKVLEALYVTTGQDWGYKPDVWRQWYISEYTVVDYNVREDFDQ